MPVILQRRLSDMPWMRARGLNLPGTRALPENDWLFRDECFAAQTAYKRALLVEKRECVRRVQSGSKAACLELYQTVCSALGQQRGDVDDPLAALVDVTQEDWVVLQKPGGSAEHIATAGLLCFPASWTLAQKIGHPLTRIHKPVAGYAGDIARRVERMISGLQPGRPVWRSNVLIYNTPELHHPLEEGQHRLVGPGDEHFVRVERQTLRKLPKSGAVAFGIHTSIVRAQDLPGPAFIALAKIRPVIGI